MISARSLPKRREGRGQPLVAIADPAPSIPARFRLYHGGTPKRGYLVTHSPRSGAYLGDYVYFSGLKSYAREYVERKPRRGRARLYVIDARHLPAGTRMLRAEESAWPPRNVGLRLFDLIDMTSDLRSLLSLLEAHATPSLLAPNAPREVRRAVAIYVGQVHYIRRAAREACAQLLINPKTLRALKRAQRELLGAEHASKLALPTPLDDEYATRDRHRSLALFLLERFGTLDVSLSTLRTATSLYREDWLDAFTTPLDVTKLEPLHQEAAGRPHGTADHTRTVIVPGPIPVLPEHKRAPLERRQRRVRGQ